MRVPTCNQDTSPLPGKLPKSERSDGMPKIEGPDVHYPRSMGYEEKCEADVQRIKDLKD